MDIQNPERMNLNIYSYFPLFSFTFYSCVVIVWTDNIQLPVHILGQFHHVGDEGFIGLNYKLKKHGSEVIIVQMNLLEGTISIHLYLPNHQDHRVHHDLL